jgi:hypothetical protein
MERDDISEMAFEKQRLQSRRTEMTYRDLDTDLSLSLTEEAIAKSSHGPPLRIAEHHTIDPRIIASHGKKI